MNRLTLKKIFTISLILIAAAVVLLSSAAAMIYWHNVKKNTPVEQLETKLSPSPAQLGQTVQFGVTLKSPWHQRPQKATVIHDVGIQVIDKPSISLQKIGFGYIIWKISADFKPYRTGFLQLGKMIVKFNQHQSLPSLPDMHFDIPGLEVEPLPLDKAENPLLAPPMTESPGILHNINRLYLVVGLILLLLLLFAIYLIIGHKRNADQIVVTPWGTALLELTELREELSNNKISLELCLFKLTDIVREYIEKRFLIHAPQQTTYEFLAELNLPGSPLPEQHRPFLQEFMTAADLIKFAKLPPDEQVVITALDKAEKLVSETRPDLQTDAVSGGVK